MCLRRRTLALILSPFLPISTPLLLLVLAPFELYRQLVLKCAKKFRPDLAEPLTVISNAFAMEFPQMFQNLSRCAIVAAHKIQGHVDLTEFRDTVLQKMVHKKIGGPDNHQILYPELRQTISSFGGYLFWKWDGNFRIENHVKNYSPVQNQDPDHTIHGVLQDGGDSFMSLILNDLRCRSFCGGQSPWEILVWNKNHDKKCPDSQSESIVVIHCHHALADGQSLLQMLLEDIIGGKMADCCPKPRSSTIKSGNKMMRPPPPQKRRMEYSTSNIIWHLLFRPYQILKLVFETWDINEWHLSEKKLSTHLNCAMSKRISIQNFRSIMTKHECTFNAVIAAGFGGALRKIMLEMGVKLPPVLHTQVPLRLPGHPMKLSNYFLAVLAPLPVGISDASERIRAIQRSLDELGNSEVAWIIYIFRLLLNPLPANLIRIVARNSLTTCILSNFPGPTTQVRYKNQPVTDIMYSLCHLVGNIGIGLGTLSYNGGVRIDISVNEAILPEQWMVEHFLKYFLEELQLLQ